MGGRTWPALIVGVALAARAQDPALEQRALLDLYVNDVKGETVLVYLPDSGDALVPVEELTKAGVRGFAGVREMHGGVEYVSARSLAPAVTFALDLEKLAVRLVAQPSLLGTQKLDLRPTGRPVDYVLRSDTSGFLNYSVTGTSGVGMSGAAELGATYGTNLAYTGLSYAQGGSIIRGLSNVTLDDVGALRRTVVGDTFVTAGSLGGSVLLGGVSIARNFSLDPYFVRTPMPRMQGAALTPSTLDVYVNGTLVRSVPVAPGTFDVANVPVTGGAGTYSYVLRDAFGRTQEYAAPYYASPGLLSKGLTEYSYAAGLRRLDFGLRSFSYAPPALSASHRVGLTDTLTVGARFEAALQHLASFRDDIPCTASCGNVLASGGASIDLGLPYGELAAEASASSDGGAAGGAALLGYNIVNRRMSAGVAVRAMSSSYATLSLPAAQDRERLGVHAFVAVVLPKNLTLTLASDLSSMRDSGVTSQTGARLDLRLSQKTIVTTSIARERQSGIGPEWVGSAGLIYMFGERTLAQADGTSDHTGRGGTFSVQRSNPIGEGIGYHVTSALDGRGMGSGSGFVQAQLANAVVNGTYSRFGDANMGSATVAGGLVTVGGEMFASRPVSQGYALLQVPGLEGVRGYLNNQEIGRTDSRGDLVVPDLLPYYGNKLSISPQDLPLEYVVSSASATVGIPFRGGSLVRFDAARIQAVSGTVRVGGDVPAYGELTVSAGKFAQSSPLGARGEFFLERMQPGRYHAAVEFKAGTCSFDMDVPDSRGPQVDLGPLVCTALRPAATAAESSRPAEQIQ